MTTGKALVCAAMMGGAICASAATTWYVAEDGDDVNNDGKVTGLVVSDAHETFGLGGNALTDHEFLAQFLNKTGSFEVETHGADAFSGATAEAAPAEGEAVSVDAITGATVTSKAVVRCVNSAIAFVTGADTVTEATSWGG